MVERVRNKRTPRRRAPKGTPTELNLWVMRGFFAGKTRARNQISPPSVPHLRRCLKAGLIEVEGTELVLTLAGVEAMTDG